MRRVGLGLLGFGQVGQGIAQALQINGAHIAATKQVDFSMARVGVRDLTKPRDVSIECLTDDLESVVDDPNVDMILEAMGGLEPARTLALRAIAAGKPFATANKALVATHGPELFEAARWKGVGFRFESSVCAGTPMIAALDRQLGANVAQRIEGIVNGTTNFILTLMTQRGSTYEEALAEAVQLHYAEADPSSDVDGWDAAYKIAILGAIASGNWIDPESVVRKGIRQIATFDILGAATLGGKIKLIADYRRLDSGELSARVEPKVVLNSHPLYELDGVRNGVSIHANLVDRVFFAGPGAGGIVTASGLIGDAIELAQGGSVPYPWRLGAKIRKARHETTAFALFVNQQGPRVVESVERLLRPLQVVRSVESPSETIVLTETCDEALLSAALDRDGGALIRTSFPVCL